MLPTNRFRPCVTPLESRLTPTVPTVQGVVINGGAAQRSRVDVIDIQFDPSAPVNFQTTAANAITVTQVGTNNPVVVSATPTPVGGPYTAVSLAFIGGAIDGPNLPFHAPFSLAEGVYVLSIDGSQVSNGPDLLDGDGDGVPGGTFVTPTQTPNRIYRLFGDSDGDADVDAVDYGAFKSAYGSVAGNTFYLQCLDLHNDGDVDSWDYLGPGAFLGQFGKSI